MRDGKKSNLFAIMVVVLALSVAGPSFGQESGQTQDQSPAKSEAQAGARASHSVPAGQEIKASGVILKRTADNFTMLSERGEEIVVTLTNDTEVKEKKSNPFRRARNYATTQLLRGLQVQVEGAGDSAGTLVAEEIRFKDDDFRVASSIESRVTPVEGKLVEAETRLSQSEQNAQRMSGQIDELTSISNAARGGAKAAQETADAAVLSAQQANQSAQQANTGVRVTNERISALDDFEVKNSATVKFRVGSAVLSKEGQATLDSIAEEAKNEKGFVLEVTGFASADGNEAYNRRLSQRRADAVIQYLAENHEIPLRRLITPFGYGEKMPVADNSTREGRQQNRRVEVRILVNKGLVQSASTQSGSSTQSAPQNPENR
jgi:outer membrane protein OmpA-like peptidoglycan-associated protein